MWEVAAWFIPSCFSWQLCFFGSWGREKLAKYRVRAREFPPIFKSKCRRNNASNYCSPTVTSQLEVNHVSFCYEGDTRVWVDPRHWLGLTLQCSHATNGTFYSYASLFGWLSSGLHPSETEQEDWAPPIFELKHSSLEKPRSICLQLILMKYASLSRLVAAVHSTLPCFLCHQHLKLMHTTKMFLLGFLLVPLAFLHASYKPPMINLIKFNFPYSNWPVDKPSNMLDDVFWFRRWLTIFYRYLASWVDLFTGQVKPHRGLYASTSWRTTIHY